MRTSVTVGVGVGVGYPRYPYYPWYGGWGIGFGWGGWGGWYSPWYAPYAYGGWYGWQYPYSYGPYPYGPYPAGPYPMYFDDRTVSLRLDVKPREAEVFVDGYRVGKVDDFDGTFQRLHIRSGPHDLVFYCAGYRTQHQQIDIEAYASQKITSTMVRLEPGETTGPHPEPADPKAPAPNELRPPSRSHTEPTHSAEAAPASENFGAVSIRVLPADADVFVDGEHWTTPANHERLVIEVSDGRHKIEVKKDGFETYVNTVTVRRGVTTTVNVSLLKGS